MVDKLAKELAENPNIIALIRLPITADALNILTAAINDGINLKMAVCSVAENWLILETQ